MTPIKMTVLCYIQKNGKTLMLHRTKKENDIHKGKWNGVGGKIEHNESPEEAVKRESLEETGLQIEPILKGIITYPQTNNGEYTMVFVFISKKFSGKLIECNEGDLEWIENKNLKKLNMWKGDYYFLPLLNKKGIFTAKITYDKEKVTELLIKKY
ncbi:MAG: 8-oxo-dGTP diphosphatase [archaeon]|jgi:8-oxo-dGTP diphosphatase